MSAVIPAGVRSDGTRRAFWVEGGLADRQHPTLAEITSGVDISCYLTIPGITTTTDQATITDQRLCSSQDFQIPGRKTKSITLEYTFNLNEPAEDTARTELTEGSVGDLVIVYQVDEDEAVATSDWVKVWPLKLGEQNESAVAANALDRITQTGFVVGEVTDFVQIVGGS